VRRSSQPRNIAEWVYRHKAEWRGTSENLFLDRQRQTFMLYIIDNELVDCECWSYEIDGKIAAALVTFHHGTIRHFYTIHHDPKWARFSPGQVMIFDVTRESLAEGLDVDFMTGEYPYKNRLATAMVPLYRASASVAQMAAWSSKGSSAEITAA
jgi:CelD/BcsL family acetyltransferase involved in cellulose biosynthesis